MNTIRISAAGMALTAVAFVVSTIDDGFLGASAFVVAIFAALVTLGVASAIAIDALVDRAAGRSSSSLRSSLRRRFSGGGSSTVTCGSCGRGMVHTDHVWLCERCDRVPAVP